MSTKRVKEKSIATSAEKRSSKSDERESKRSKKDTESHPEISEVEKQVGQSMDAHESWGLLSADVVSWAENTLKEAQKSEMDDASTTSKKHINKLISQMLQELPDTRGPPSLGQAGISNLDTEMGKAKSALGRLMDESKHIIQKQKEEEELLAEEERFLKTYTHEMSQRQKYIHELHEKMLHPLVSEGKQISGVPQQPLPQREPPIPTTDPATSTFYTRLVKKMSAIADAVSPADTTMQDLASVKEAVEQLLMGRQLDGFDDLLLSEDDEGEGEIEEEEEL